MEIEIKDKIVDKIVKGRNEIIKKGASIDNFLTRNEYNALIDAMETAQQTKEDKKIDWVYLLAFISVFLSFLIFLFYCYGWV